MDEKAADEGGAQVFTFLSEEIVAGSHFRPGATRGDLVLPGTEDLTARIKVYETGGENVMHSHPSEDHAFYVLQGTATFHVEQDENVAVVSANEAILLPKGTRYWFTNTGEGNLVFLRVGTSESHKRDRLDADGNVILPKTVMAKATGRALG